MRIVPQIIRWLELGKPGLNRWIAFSIVIQIINTGLLKVSLFSISIL